MLHLDNLPDTFDEHLRILERLEGRAIGDLCERIWSIARKSETLQCWMGAICLPQRAMILNFEL